MDVTAIISQIYHAPWYVITVFLLAALLIAALLASAIFKGFAGEAKVNFLVRWRLDKQNYHLIKNVTLPTEKGTTQIDHIIVSRYGVFVIETKTMKGWLFGSPTQKQWTQKINNYSSQFQNPLHQNYKHLKTLQNILGLTDDKLHPVVVFAGSSRFKTPMPNNVIPLKGFIKHIRSKRHRVLSSADVSDIVRRINTNRLTPSLQTHLHHTRHVRSVTQRNNNNRKPIAQVLSLLLLGGFVLWSALGLISSTVTEMIEQFGQQTVQNSRNTTTHPPQQSTVKKKPQAAKSDPVVEKVQPKTVSVVEETQLISQKSTADSEEQERQLARQKEIAWQQFYQRPEKCLDINTRQRLTECGNHYIVQKREFEAKWREGLFRTKTVISPSIK